MQEQSPKGLPFQIYTPGVSVWLDKSAPEGRQRRIGGLVTTDNRDRQGEVVIQKGLDFSEFLSSGWYNDNHDKSTDSPVGYPEATSLKYLKKGDMCPDGRKAPGNGHWAEGYLLESERANRIWDLAQSLHKAGDERRLGFSIEGSIQKRVGKDRKTIAKAKVRNVAITNCFPGDVRVVGAGQSITRRLYSGPMVEVVLATGEKLTGTPNHPVFTQRGWIPLGDLDERYDRVGRFVPDALGGRPLLSSATPVVPHHVDDVPTKLQELFDLAAHDASWFSRRVRSIRVGDFHGDVLVDGDVDIVAFNRTLQRYLAASFFQQFGKDALIAADKELSRLSGFGALLQGREVIRAIASSLVGRLRSRLALSGGQDLVTSDLFFSAGPTDARPFGDIEHRRTGDGVTGGDRGRALSSAIGFSDLVSKRCFEFYGHVYNLDTVHGWYGANGIVAHNCPVNTDTRMETLVKSMLAVERADNEGWTPEELWKALGMGTATGGPLAHPAGPQTGGTAGQVLAVESLERKKRKDEDEDAKKSLTPELAWGLARARFPFITAEQVGRLVKATEILKARGAI